MFLVLRYTEVLNIGYTKLHKNFSFLTISSGAILIKHLKSKMESSGYCFSILFSLQTNYLGLTNKFAIASISIINDTLR